MNRINYLKRIFSAYILKKNSQLTFWHGEPEVNEDAFKGQKEKLGFYYMKFHKKADYRGPFDERGVPLLDYHGTIGKQYNPIAIAQYGLGNYNLFKSKGERTFYDRCLTAADWLADNLEKNEKNVSVWNHKFDWEYFQILKAPWYSALAQGQGLSLLLRAFAETGKEAYLAAARDAFTALVTKIEDGGVLFIDDKKNSWLEEYLVDPPSHILNGFIWAVWGVYDFYLLTGDDRAKDLFQDSLRTISQNLYRFDAGYWSLYDLSENNLRTMASRFYHDLHIVQLDVLYRITGEKVYFDYFKKWKQYRNKRGNRLRAFVYKCFFKLLYY